MSDQDYEEDQDFENYDDIYDENTEVKKIIPPNDFKKRLLACVNCFFLLTQEQWTKDYMNCPNCDAPNNNPKPTPKFTGITCITDPSKSWQTNRMRLVKRIDVKVPGAYAVNIAEDYDINQVFD
ncbi:hypothetical protein ABPG72_011536 [Tetrahymena utriculariae]